MVLVRPETIANIGAVARVIRNTGMGGLDLVAPGDWRTIECWRTAWGAHELLEGARVFDDLKEALRDASFVAALSGRRDSGPPVLDVRDLAAEVASLNDGERCALVFGPESTGLTDGEMALCGRRARIPSHPDQPSLNLSHAVMVTAYEVFRTGRRSAPGTHLASHEEKQRLVDLLREGLLAIEALPDPVNDGFFQEWQGIFTRADLTPREVRLLEHMARKMAKAGRRAAEPRPA